MALGWVTDWHDYEIRAVTKSGVPGISPGYMHESTPISTVLRKSVRFFIINIFKIWKMVWTNLFFSKFQALDRLWDFQIWDCRCLVYVTQSLMHWLWTAVMPSRSHSETQEMGCTGVKIQQISWGTMLPDPPRSLRLWCSFNRKSVSILLRRIKDEQWQEDGPKRVVLWQAGCFVACTLSYAYALPPVFIYNTITQA